MYKTRRKVIASLLVFILTMAHLSTFGQAIASSLEDQNTTTNVSNVEFDAYFKQDKQKNHSTTKTINAENYIYAAIKVKDAGYLKNAQIEIKDANFAISKELSSEQISKVDGNKISLNRIKAGNNIEIPIPIQIIETNGTISLEQLSKQNNIRLTGTYVDGKGKENKVEKDIKINLTWTDETKAEFNMQISKYIPYSINESKGILLQTVVQSYLKDNTLPVKENKIEILVPSINQIKPQEIKVLANSTKATNGDEKAESFTKENYTYNVEENKLTIIVQNKENENGQVSWKKQAQDEFLITYIYPEEALNSISEDGVKLTINANNYFTVYGANLEKVNKEFSGEVTLKDKISNLVDFTINTNIETISKGQIYANYQVENKLETEYSQSIIANVALAELTDKIVLEQNIDNFMIDENTKTPASETYYKTITVDKNEYDKLLGQNGEIKFYLGTTEIAKISEETQVNAQGKFVVDLSELNINSLRIETSKPQTEGKLNFDIVKAIKGDTQYSKIEMKSFTELELNLSAKALAKEIEFENQSFTKTIAFIEPTSKAELIIDNNNLSTVVTNKNVKMTAILRTDSLDCMLYQNPTLQITLPSYIENINIKNIEVLFDTETTKLTLKDSKILQNADGTKTIVLTLEGMQTEYTLGAVSKGVNVVISSDITVNKLTPNKQEQIKMTYTNNNVITRARTPMQEVATINTPINFVAPVGVVTTNSISNYKEGAEELISISGEEKVATIDTMAEARNVNFKMSVINNYNNTIDNISILGRTPFKANKQLETSEDLGSTINMPLTSAISVSNIDLSKVKIYYSENGEATKDLNTTSNGWTLDTTNLANVKSYLIVLQDVSMNTADTINFTYDAQIPANLQYNESAFENYVVYFNNNLDTGTIQDKQLATKIGITTGRGPVLEASMTSNVEETQEVLAGDIIKYTLTVKNIGTENANDVIATLATEKENEQEETEVVLEIPEGLKYVEQDEENPENYNVKASSGKVDISLGTIAPNETITKDIYMEVNYLQEDKIVTNIKTVVTASNASQTQTNTLKNTLAKTYFITSNTVLKDEEDVLKEGEELTYHMSVISSGIYETRQNSVIEITLPEELILQKLEIKEKQNGKETDITDKTTYEHDKKQNKITINLGNVTGTTSKIIYLKTKVGTLANNVYSKDLIVDANVSQLNGRKESIKFETVKVGKVAFKVTQNSNIPEYATIAAYEDFKYIFTIENLSDLDLYNVKVTDILPEELILSNMEVIYESKYESTNTVTSNTNSININMKGKEIVTIEVNVRAKALDENKTITNKAIIEYEEKETMTSLKYTHIIEKFDSTGIDNPIDPSYTQKRIMGTVWEDNNKNGIRDEDEEKLPNVEVMLFNNKTADLVRNLEGKVLKQVTDSNGTYTFDKIPQGKYTVIFLYDVANYSATTYRKENVDNTLNSDAIDTKITLDGQTRVAAITEEIRITDSNIYNIDLGLVSNPKFDLKLDKTVSKITINDAKGTNVYEFNDSKLAKKDLVGKQIAGTTIIVEYKIKVTNEGAISGFVKKIADYIPQEMKFNSELNRDWYTSENGVLYNSSLSNTIINPGESKVVTLTLTKKMTEDNLGLYHNEAEIYEAYNDLGIEDIDSIEGNKASNEDDISSADVLITVKTGEVILFIGLSISILITIGISVYFIKKNVLR